MLARRLLYVRAPFGALGGGNQSTHDQAAIHKGSSPPHACADRAPVSSSRVHQSRYAASFAMPLRPGHVSAPATGPMAISPCLTLSAAAARTGRPCWRPGRPGSPRGPACGQVVGVRSNHVPSRSARLQGPDCATGVPSLSPYWLHSLRLVCCMSLPEDERSKIPLRACVIQEQHQRRDALAAPSG
jgi:hypothetical protein